jgi:hypothetical protein
MATIVIFGANVKTKQDFIAFLTDYDLPFQLNMFDIGIFYHFSWTWYFSDFSVFLMYRLGWCRRAIDSFLMNAWDRPRVDYILMMIDAADETAFPAANTFMRNLVVSHDYYFGRVGAIMQHSASELTIAMQLTA